MVAPDAMSIRTCIIQANWGRVLVDGWIVVRRATGAHHGGFGELCYGDVPGVSVDTVVAGVNPRAGGECD